MADANSSQTDGSAANEAQQAAPAAPKIETQLQKQKRLAREAKEAEVARVAELKRQEEAAQREEAERLRVEKEKQDKLNRRAERILKILVKFLERHVALLNSMKTVQGVKKEKPKKDKAAKKSGSKKKQPSEEQASWMEMLTEVDNKINENKSCSLDDIMNAFSMLTEEQKRQMICIMESINKKSLPKGRDLKDTQSIIQKTLMMATFANNYRREKIPVLKNNTTATDLRNKGFSTAQVHELGFQPHSLRSAKCKVEEVVDAVDSLEQLYNCNVTVQDLAGANSVKHQIHGYKGAMKLRAAGYNANEIRKAGTHSAWELRSAGYSLEELKGAGFLELNLREAGFGTKIKQPAGEGLTAMVSSAPASYAYQETQAKLKVLSDKLASGVTETLEMIT